LTGALELNTKIGQEKILPNFLFHLFLPYKCHCEAFFCRSNLIFYGHLVKKQIATPPKNKNGGSQ